MNSDGEKLLVLLHDSVVDESLRKAVFSKPTVKSDASPGRIDVRPVSIKGQTLWQVTSRVGTQEHHRNLDATAVVQEMHDYVGTRFRDVRLQTTSAEWVARHNRRGLCSLKQTTTTTTTSTPMSAAIEHDRTREYLIPDGTPCPFLIATGIMSAAGQVHAKHYRKFRQINRYVEFIRDVADRLPDNEPIHVVDFGCGKSYLTFATHYFLTQILKRPAVITGLDRRPDVIATCNKIVTTLDLTDIRFEEGDIAAYQPQQHVHLAISLHACDTATDDALASAVAWNTDVIFAVPCCQHELASQLSRKQQPLFSNHGILHERFASLATDAIRAALLSAVGYDTQVIEFIDLEHTPKNLLIRAIRRSQPELVSDRPENREQIERFSNQLGVLPLRLQQKLQESGLLP
ncbi:MAG: SAM-dependent methyltransferase [Planctomycetaceae bacterium]